MVYSDSSHIMPASSVHARHISLRYELYNIRIFERHKVAIRSKIRGWENAINTFVENVPIAYIIHTRQMRIAHDRFSSIFDLDSTSMI